MLEEKLITLSSKESLDGDDAFSILKLLQDHTTPILSLRSVGSSPAASSGRHHTSKPTKTSGLLATGRKSAGVERSRDGMESGSREGERRRSGEGKSTPELQNSSLGVPSRRTLFGPGVESRSEPRSSSDGVLGAKTALNFNSLEEFPPMQSAAAIQTRKKDKNTSKPRRITLTSMQQPQHQSGTSTPHFTLPLNTTDSWSSHPAFVVEETTSSVPSPLSEERRLLRKERSRQLKKSNGSTTKYLSTHTETEFTPSPRPTSQSTDSVPCTPVDSRCRVTPSTTPLDTGIHQQPLSHTNLSAMVKGSEADSSLSSLPHLADECSTALTSTPLLGNLFSGSQYVVSTERVSNREALDGLAQLYSKIILDRLVPNLTSEIHLLVQLLTCTQLASQTQIVPMGSEYLFESVENCVYFAVRALYNIKNILTALDKATLQLLCDNVRIKQMEPRLSIFLSEALITTSNETSSDHRSPSQRTFKRVPFQEDTDNVKNFPNMKVFHAFKKQRDAFYSALQEWELHHNMPDWNFQSVLRDRIRLLMNQPPELCSLHHLAILFQKQLLESCGYAAHMSAGVDGLEGPLKNLNPGKLMKLSERFQRQSHVSTGTCPPPTFSKTELFFSAFITTADSYIFNHNLSATLHYELLKLHSRCETMLAKDIPEALYALRLLAKFLGFLDFLPYSSVASSSLLPSRTASPHVATLTECVCEARKKGHLSLTIPWVVDYMSMMDSHALQLTQYHTLLSQLMMVYRCVEVGSESVSTDNFLVLTCLGWLFEIPNISNSAFFEFLKEDTIPDTTLALPSHAKPQANLVTQEVLYTCCPYLAGIRVTLAEFAAGLQSKTSPIRKITPIPAGTDIPLTHITPSSQLQRKLKDNFFRSHPPNLKHVCDSVSERVSETAISLVQSGIIPDHTRRGLRLLADWIANRVCSEQCNPNSSVDIDEIFYKGEAVSTVARVSEQTFTSVLKEATEFCKRHSETNTKTAIASLLCDTISEQVMAVAIGITTDWAVEQCMKWMHCKLRGIVYQEVRGEFDKLKKAVRTGGKANSSGSTLDADSSVTHLQLHAAPFLDTPSSVNQHGHLSPQSGGQHSISIQSSKSSHNVPDNPFPDRLDISENDISHQISDNGPISQFMELATSALKKRDECPSAESVQRMVSAAAGVRVFIAAQVTVIEGGNSPHLLPNGVDKLLTTSVQLVAHLVSHGLLYCKSEEPVFVMEIISLWSFLKDLKQELPIHLLLSSESITHYLQQVNKDVWHSLSYLLMEVIEFNIVTPDVVEALWMCRIKHSPPQQKQAVINGSAVFLAMWYDHDRRQEQGNPGVFREVCFLRLLSLVVNKSDISFTASLKNHPSLPYLTV